MLREKKKGRKLNKQILGGKKREKEKEMLSLGREKKGMVVEGIRE